MNPRRVEQHRQRVKGSGHRNTIPLAVGRPIQYPEHFIDYRSTSSAEVALLIRSRSDNAAPYRLFGRVAGGGSLVSARFSSSRKRSKIVGNLNSERFALLPARILLARSTGGSPESASMVRCSCSILSDVQGEGRSGKARPANEHDIWRADAYYVDKINNETTSSRCISYRTRVAASCSWPTSEKC